MIKEKIFKDSDQTENSNPPKDENIKTNSNFKGKLNKQSMVYDPDFDRMNFNPLMNNQRQQENEISSFNSLDIAYLNHIIKRTFSIKSVIKKLLQIISYKC